MGHETKVRKLSGSGDTDDLQRLKNSSCMRWFKAFEAGDGIAMREARVQTNKLARDLLKPTRAKCVIHVGQDLVDRTARQSEKGESGGSRG
jgi:hypothetical protein